MKNTKIGKCFDLNMKLTMKHFFSVGKQNFYLFGHAAIIKKAKTLGNFEHGNKMSGKQRGKKKYIMELYLIKI